MVEVKSLNNYLLCGVFFNFKKKMITEAEDFNYKGASKIEINDGCIKCIWLEHSKTNELDKENSIMLRDGCMV